MENLDSFKDLLKSCFVPELLKDLDEIPINEDDFDNYRKTLEIQLPLLYDFIQQERKWEESEDATEIRCQILLLFSEITTESAPFRLISPLLDYARNHLRTFRALTDEEEKYLFGYYQKKLKKDLWKKQIGAVHGFANCLRWRFKDKNMQMSIEWMQLGLAVGLRIHECSDPYYKFMGLEVFSFILSCGVPKDVENLNIHAVIYEEIFNDIYLMDHLQGTKLVWSCLIQCLNFFQEFDSLNWSHADDLLDKLIHHVIMSSSNDISMSLMTYVTKLCSFLSLNRRDLEEICLSDSSNSKSLQHCREICLENTSYTPYRWATKILEMLVLESQKLFVSPNHYKRLILEIHKCYMICILPIPVPVVFHHLTSFYEKFVAVLVESTFVTHKGENDIIELAKDLILTFIFHLDTFPEYEKKNPEVSKFKEAMKGLLEKAFLK